MMEDPAAVSDEQWDGFPTVNNPTVPYVGQIPGGIKPGKTIHVKGQVNKNATKFNVNLQCGENSLPYADAALHFSAKFDDTVVRNTRVGGEWGMEERDQDCPSIPFIRGEHFEMVIQCEADKYKIYVNGKHYIDYKHRLPLENVDHISFKVDIEVEALRYGKGNVEEFMKTKGRGSVENNSVENNHTEMPKTPFAQPIKDRLQAGSLIYISGSVPQFASVFSINLQQDGDSVPGMNCALHIKSMFQSQLVCSSVVDETWGMQEMSDLFPFRKGRRFSLKMQCQTTGYKVWVDKKTILDYDHRISDLDRINCISLDGHIEINSIRFTQEDEDEEGESSSVDNGVAEQRTSGNMEQESVSANSVEEEQSNDSTKQSSEDKEEQMEVESGDADASLTSRDADASPTSRDADASPTSVDADASPASPTTDDSAKDSITEKDSPKVNPEQKSAQKSSENVTKDTKKNSDEAQGDEEPERKKRKLDEEANEDEEADEDAGDESGADSDDSEQKDGDFDVERILTRRKGPDGDEYLLKWGGWSLYDCTWEPEANVSKGVKRAFGKPIITTGRLVASCDIFYESIQSHLSGSRSSEQIKLRIEHDILRNVLCDGGRPADKADPTGWKWYNKSDLQAWNLPDNWWYRLDKKGSGKQVSFPIKMKVQLDWTPLSYVVDKHRKLIPAKRKPLENLLIQMKKRDYKL